MATQTEIITEIKTGQGAYLARGPHGTKLLTLSYSPRRSCFRFFRGPKPGGGGRKHTCCDEARAIELLTKFPGGRIDREPMLFHR